MVVKIFGGLGNQMFQYAFARSLAHKYNSEVWLDCSEFGKGTFITDRKFALNIFNITLPVISNDISQRHHYYIKPFKLKSGLRSMAKQLPLLFRNWVVEKNFTFDKTYQRKADYYEGYWQSPKYFDDIREILVNDFSIKSLNTINKNLENDIAAHESVAIHVRRGDYANNPKVQKHHGLLSVDYYERAIDHILKLKKSHVKLYVFSDEIDWVKDNMFKNMNAHFVKNSVPEHDLYLMSLCKNNIVANSTFSWWAAYLNSNTEKIVIAPKNWFNANLRTTDLIPKEWISL